MVIYIDVASPGITLHPAPHRLIILHTTAFKFTGLLWNFRMRSTLYEYSRAIVISWSVLQAPAASRRQAVPECQPTTIVPALSIN
jgi:hypothetical protein